MCDIEVISFMKSLTFIQLHQFCSVHYPYRLTFSVSHSWLTHTFTANIPSFFHILLFRYTALLKIFEYHFWRVPAQWSLSTGTAVLCWTTLLSQLVSEHGPCQEPFRTQLFQMIFKGLFTSMCK